MKLFISHASDDSELAALLVQLLRSSLGLGAPDIRCTSVDGYKLPAGVVIDNQLRDEVSDCQCFIGILSARSLSSTYVLFELGARWGAKKHLLPLLGPGLTHQALRPPLSGLNVLSCNNKNDFFKLVSELANVMELNPESPDVYMKHVDAVAYYCSTQEVPIEPEEPSPPARFVPIPSDDSYSESETVIRQHCEREWPDDDAMRANCIEQQHKAVDELNKGRPTDVPEEVFRRIRRRCASEWPFDYAMRRYCEQQQLSAFRRVGSRGSRQ